MTQVSPSSDGDRRESDSVGSGSRWSSVNDEVAEQAFRVDAAPPTAPWPEAPLVRRPGEVAAAAVLLFVSAAFRMLAGLAAALAPSQGILLVIRHFGLAAAEIYVGRRLLHGASGARKGALVLAVIGLIETGFIMVTGSLFGRFLALPGLAYSIAIVVCVCTPAARRYLRPGSGQE